MKLRPVGHKLFHDDGRTDGRTDMTNLRTRLRIVLPLPGIRPWFLPTPDSNVNTELRWLLETNIEAEKNKGEMKSGLRSRSHRKGACLHVVASNRVSINTATGFMFLAACCNAGLCASLAPQSATLDGPLFSAFRSVTFVYLASDWLHLSQKILRLH